MDPKRETPLYPRSFLIPLRGVSLRKERKRKKRKRSRNLLLLFFSFDASVNETCVCERIWREFSRIDGRFRAEFVKIDSHHEKLLYKKKSREQGGEEKLENNRGDRVAVLTPFLFFLSSSLSLSSSLFDESLSRLKLMDEAGNRSRGGEWNERNWKNLCG